MALACVMSTLACAVPTRQANNPPENSQQSSIPNESGLAKQSAKPQASGQSSARPNVLVLMTDDQNLSDIVAMPRTAEWFRKNGTEFTHAVSNFPLCCPARSTTLTGQQAHNHQVLSNRSPRGAFPKLDDTETLPVWLERAGYRTIMLGKYLQEYPDPNRSTYVPPGWSDWFVPIVGPYHYDKYVINENGTPKRYEEYQTDYMERRLGEILGAPDITSRPWFLWASFLAPHGGTPEEADDPRTIKQDISAADTPAVSEKYRDSISGNDALASKSFNESDLSDKPRFMQSLPMQDREDMIEVVAQRRESLKSVDDAVISTLGTLQRTGQLKNTIVIFISDNGFLTGEHRWNHKILGYEESIRVPLFVSGPGFPPGQKREQLVNLADLTATALEAADAQPKREQDGLPLQDFAADPRYMEGRVQLLEAADWPVRTADRIYTGVRAPNDLVLLNWYDGTKEVYDLKTDPWQLDGKTTGREEAWLPELERLRRLLVTCKGSGCNLELK